jgi:hypothetical protein
MTADPVEILNRRNAEVAKIRRFADLTEEAKEWRIAEVSERAERLERRKRAVFRVPVSATATYAEEAQVHPAFRSAYNDVYSATLSSESPEQAQEELERLLEQAERSGDKLLARGLPQGNRPRRTGRG